jgi:PTS system galactitol-specific IIA component
MDPSCLFDENIVLVELNGTSREDLLTTLTQALVQAGYVQPEYVDAVLEREKDFPTGLPTEPVAVAIPHGSPECVIKSGVAVGVLSNPVAFQEMGTPTNTVDVRLVFVLAIREVESQTEILQRFMQIFQARALLEQLCVARKPENIVKLLKAEISRPPA